MFKVENNLQPFSYSDIWRKSLSQIIVLSGTGGLAALFYATGHGTIGWEHAEESLMGSKEAGFSPTARTLLKMQGT